MRRSFFPQAIRIFNVQRTVAYTPSVRIYVYTDCIYFSQTILLPIVPCTTNKDNLNLKVQQNFQKLRENKWEAKAFRQMAEESKGPRLASQRDDHRKIQGPWPNG